MSAAFGPVRRVVAAVVLIAVVTGAATALRLYLAARDDMRVFRAEVQDVLLMHYQRQASPVDDDLLAIRVGETRRDLRSLYAEVGNQPEPARRDRITQWLRWDVLTVGNPVHDADPAAPRDGPPDTSRMVPGIETRKVKTFRVGPDGTISR